MSEIQKTKNQHYVPQGYLEKFTYDGSRLFVFDKFSKKSYPTHTKNIASETYFYDVHSDLLQDFHEQVSIRGYPPEDSAIIERASDPQLVEHELSAIESVFYRERNELLNTLNNMGSIKPDQKEAMAYFMTIQMLRTPEARRAFIELQESMVTKLLDDEELFAQYDQKYASLEHAAFMFSPEIQQASMHALSNHIWIVGNNQTSQPLLTSDTPVVMKAHSAQFREIGVQVPGVEIAFPLSPRFILILLERNFFRNLASQDCTSCSLSANQVTYYNRLQVLRSYRQVYSSSDDFSMVEQICQRFQDICDPDRTYVRARWHRKGSSQDILHFRQPDPDRAQFEVH